VAVAALISILEIFALLPMIFLNSSGSDRGGRSSSLFCVGDIEGVGPPFSENSEETLGLPKLRDLVDEL
jgi:hypothetical protein